MKNRYVSKFPLVVFVTAALLAIFSITEDDEIYRYSMDNVNVSSSSKGKLFNLFLFYLDKHFGRYGVIGFFALAMLACLPFAFNLPLIIRNMREWIRKQKGNINN